MITIDKVHQRYVVRVLVALSLISCSYYATSDDDQMDDSLR